VRRAQHLEIRGSYAAVAWDREAVRHLGTAGLAIEDRGEDHALVADVPGTLRHALMAPTEVPWRDLLAGLGYAGDRPVVVQDGDRPAGIGIPAGRVFRVMEAWSTLRAWFFGKDARLTVELEARPGGEARLREALARAVAAPEADWRPTGLPPRAKAWLWVPTGEARDALGAALFGAGVALPGPAPGAPSPAGPAGGLLAWAEIVPSAPHAWTLGFAAPAGALPDLAPWAPGWPGGDEGLPVPAGAAAVTVYDPAANRPVPASRAVLRRAGELDLAAFGPEADAVASGGLPLGGMADVPAAPAPGLRLLALLRLDEPRARKLLGRELDERGLFAVLSGGEIAGAVWTDGVRVRVDLQRLGP
jgi:hypothetical protein